MKFLLPEYSVAFLNAIELIVINTKMRQHFHQKRVHIYNHNLHTQHIATIILSGHLVSIRSNSVSGFRNSFDGDFHDFALPLLTPTLNNGVALLRCLWFFPQRSVLAVLDCMIEQKTPSGEMIVYYHILEADEEGRVPSHSDFSRNSKSPLHIIAKEGDKVDFYSPAWNVRASIVFESYACLSVCAQLHSKCNVVTKHGSACDLTLGLLEPHRHHISLTGVIKSATLKSFPYEDLLPAGYRCFTNTYRTTVYRTHLLSIYCSIVAMV